MSIQTVLVGLDGATFSILDPLMDDGVMPFLKEFTETGVRAELRSVVPALTPPAWTSLVTGCHPGRHGIFDFFRKDKANDPAVRLLTSRDIGSPTMWSLVNEYALKATILNFPVTFPPTPIDGYLVAGGAMPWRQLRQGCYPANLYDRIKELPGFNARELAMDTRFEEKAIEGCKQNEYEGWVELHTRRERQWYDVFAALMRDTPTEVVAILFDGVDKLQHLCWRFLDPAYAPNQTADWMVRVKDACRAYFRQLDDLIRQIVETAGPDATVILASDHGFGPQVRTFFVNQWLADRGQLAWVDGQGPKASDGSTAGVGQVARHVYSLDWARTTAYAPLPSGNGIHIVRQDVEHPNGVPASEYEAMRARMMEDLMGVVDPISGERVVSRVFTREDIFPGPYVELAPDLTLELTDGGLISILAADAPVISKSEPTGTHRPEGIFIARGPALRRGARISELSILDVAPLILQSLGIPIPADLDGRLPAQALDPESEPVSVRGNRQERAFTEAAADDVGLDAESEREILKRLQALGYVE